MTGSAFDTLFAAGPRAILDATFGQAWDILPQSKQSANASVSADPNRIVISGIIGIFSDKVEVYKATHVYDVQADKRPGMTTSETQVEFPDALPTGLIDLRADDIATKLIDGSQWRILSVERDVQRNRLTCGLGRIS